MSTNNYPITDTEMNELLVERMSGLHKAAIASAHRGTHQSADTKAKISKTMAGHSNFQGKTHTTDERDRIRHARGHDDRIQGRHWIVNAKDKTYRKHSAPNGFKVGQRHWVKEHMTFKSYLKTI
jgi:hypothetical protein